jgi:NADH-quinone oxidoreductase subunit A
VQESAAAVWPFVLYGFLVFVVVAGMLALSHFLGERHRALGRNIPYESGITPTGSARLRYGIHFYTVAIFFILFDVEAVFLFAWAVAMRELGWLGYVEIVLFVAVLFLGLVYVWRLGGLDWSPSRRRGRGEGDDIHRRDAEGAENGKA